MPRMSWLKWLLAILFTLVLLLALGAAWVWTSSFPDPPTLSGTLTDDTLAVGDRERTFQLYAPEGLEPGAALVFVLHGSKLSGELMRRLTGYQFDRLADEKGFVVVYPDGYDHHWNDCRRSASYAANQENVDDPAFFRGMIDHFVKTHGVARDRVFAVGHSNGGHMAFRLALELPDAVRAVAAISANLPVTENLDCTPSKKAVSVAVMNGTEDPINPYDGGLVELLGNKSRGTVLSTEKTIAYWTGLAGIDAAPEAKELPELDGDPETRATLKTWAGTGGTRVWLYTLEGSGHVIPSRVASPVWGSLMGGNAGDLEAADAVWAFFEATE